MRTLRAPVVVSLAALAAGTLACAGAAEPSREPDEVTLAPDSAARDTTGPPRAISRFVIIQKFEEKDTLAAHEADTANGKTVARIGRDSLPIHVEPLSAGGLAQRELAELERPVTPAVWLENHPADELTRFEPGFDDWDWWDPRLVGEWCARAQLRIRTDEGHVVTRSAYFYPPPMPTPPVLPEVRDTLGADLVECSLGAVWLDFEKEPPIEGQATSRAVARALANRFGEPGPTPPLRVWDEKYWLERSSWAVGEARYVVHYDDGIEDAVRAGGWLPDSGIEAWRKSREEVEHDLGVDRARELIAVYELDRTLAESLLEHAWLGEGGFWGDVERTAEDSTLIEALDSWLSAANQSEPNRRAAALFVADLVMTHARTSALDPKGAAVRERLQRLGASFAQTYEFAYTRNWLWDAWSIGAWGPLGQHVLLELLESGFNTTPACGGGTNVFEAVIAHASTVLGQLNDPTLRARAHWIVARAYGDVVTVDSRTDFSAVMYMEEGPWTGRAPEARRLALEHYTKALEALAQTSEGPRLWREAWRVAAGLPPIGTHFVCIYD